LSPPLNAEFLVEADGVALDGVRGDAEPFGDLLVRESGAEIFEHLGLSIGEEIDSTVPGRRAKRARRTRHIEIA
jgi:hypothetical protein